MLISVPVSVSVPMLSLAFPLMFPVWLWCEAALSELSVYSVIPCIPPICTLYSAKCQTQTQTQTYQTQAQAQI
ncbi:hypothetical protein B484DRAFT_442021 [Ochromonadaceae sp. CCMP2298]|nr:hypothetical protein B484DRAFT_442021 [Ochromonadaceae sp. CCMP2298]